MPKKPEYLRLGFLEALDYFKRKNVLPSDGATKLREGAHQRALIVKGLTKINLLEDLKWLLENELDDTSEGFDVFRAQFGKLIERKGWKPSEGHIKSIYFTNMAQASRGGRYQQLQELYKQKPSGGWMWRHRTPDPQFGGQPRPEHKALDGKVFSPLDPFWEKAFPPCGWGCRCTVMWVSDRQLTAMGKTIEKAPNPDTIADKGFRYKPDNFDLQSQEMLQNGLDKASPEIRDVAAREVSNG